MHLSNNTLLQGGKYKIIRFISSGGFGNTYEGYDVNLDKKVAIKEFFVKDFCSRDSDATLMTINVIAKISLVNHLKRKFIEEARAIAKMEHENIVKVQSLFEENGTAYYVMDYIDGESLNDVLKRRGSLPEKETVAIIQKVASALDYMHKQNLFHLDIKPSNIMIRKDGKILLIDFGSSKQYAEVDGENTTTLAPCYTPGFAPTEQMNIKPTTFTAATDIYSLGATMYKMLTSNTPPSSINLLNGEEVLAPLPGNISKSIQECIAKAMIQQRNQRTQNIDEFKKALITFDAENTIQSQGNGKNHITQKLPKDTGVNESSNSDIQTQSDTVIEGNDTVRQPKDSNNSKKKWLWISIGVVTILGIGMVLKSLNNPSDESSTSKGGKASYSNSTLTVDSVTYDMIEVVGGTFTMGATEEMNAPYDDEKPAHQVTLSSYYIGKTEVTQALWKAVMGYNHSKFKGDNLPVESVSWEECQRFVSKLDTLTGKPFRLPTEAEWEFAARGGNNGNHTQYSGSYNIEVVAWYNGNSYSKTHPVATKQANELGIYDMTGNVWEWCNDKYYCSYNSSSQMTSSYPDSVARRVLRGGCWDSKAGKCRSSNRGNGAPGYRGDYLGLRLCLSE